MTGGEKLTEYERKRIENIKRNEELLASLDIKAKLSDLSAFSKLYSVHYQNRGRPSGALSIAGGGSGSGNELVVKRKRGRPRKYDPMPASLVASSDPITTTPQENTGSPSGALYIATPGSGSGSGNELVVKRKRGRPRKYGPMPASLVTTTQQKNRGRPSGALSIPTPGSGSGSGNELVVKRKRGRPRKYGPMPASLVASSDPITTTPQKNTGSPSGALYIATPGSGSGSGNELVVKRKRGRPRKYGPMPASLVASSDPSTTTPQKKRGRPRGSVKKERVADVAITQVIYDTRRSLQMRQNRPTPH